MADKTHIEWTDATWNPATGCTKVSPGCDHCYAESIAHRFAGTPAYPNGFDVTLRPERLTIPLRWKRPRRVFVNSMSDLFHADIPDEYIARVFAVMALAPQHTFQVLTKRHARMRSLLARDSFPELVTTWAWRIQPGTASRLRKGDSDYSPTAVTWPLPNVWLGVSVEDQKWADVRIPALLATPAAVRFLSCEPLLGPVGLCWCYPVAGRVDDPSRPMRRQSCPLHGPSHVDWVIVGGESGPGARPMHPDWARSLRDQCQSAGVPFLFKQWGEHAPRCTLALCGVPCSCDGANASHPTEMRRVGKRAAGRELDGRTWDEYPGVTS